MQPGTTTELNLADWFRSQGIAFKPVVVERLDEIIRSFAVGRCDAFTGDKSQLAAARSTLANPDQYVILPENFQGTARPDGAPGRRAVVQHRALDHVRHDGSRGIRHHLQERGRDAESTNPNVQRLLGVTPGMGKNLGVDDKWAYNVIKRIGNYGESYEKTWARAALKLPRGLNASYRDGGLIYGWPVRPTAPMTAPTACIGTPAFAGVLTTGNHRGNARRL